MIKGRIKKWVVLCIFTLFVCSSITVPGYAEIVSRPQSARSTLATHMTVNGRDLLPVDDRPWKAQWQSYSPQMRQARLDQHAEVIRSWQATDGQKEKMAIVSDYVRAWLDDEGVEKKKMASVMELSELAIENIKNGLTIRNQETQLDLLQKLKTLCFHPTKLQRLRIVRNALTDYFLCTGNYLSTVLEGMRSFGLLRIDPTLHFRVQCLIAGDGIIAQPRNVLTHQEQDALVSYIDTALRQAGYSTDAERLLDKRAIAEGQSDFIRFIYQVCYGELLSKEQMQKKIGISKKGFRTLLRKRSTWLLREKQAAGVKNISAYLAKIMREKQENTMIRDLIIVANDRGVSYASIAEATHGLFYKEEIRMMRFNGCHLNVGERLIIRNAVNLMSLCLDGELLLRDVTAFVSDVDGIARVRGRIALFEQWYARVLALPIVQAAMEHAGRKVLLTDHNELATFRGAAYKVVNTANALDENVAAVVAQQARWFRAAKIMIEQKRRALFLAEANNKLTAEFESVFRLTLRYVIMNDLIAKHAVMIATDLEKIRVNRFLAGRGEVPSPDKAYAMLKALQDLYDSKTILQTAKEQLQKLLAEARERGVLDKDVLAATGNTIGKEAFRSMKNGEGRAAIEDILLVTAAARYAIAIKNGNNDQAMLAAETVAARLKQRTVTETEPLGSVDHLSALSLSIEKEKAELAILQKSVAYAHGEGQAIKVMSRDDQIIQHVAAAIRTLYAMGVNINTLQANNLINKRQIKRIVGLDTTRAFVLSTEMAVLAFDAINETLVQRCAVTERNVAAYSIVSDLVRRELSAEEIYKGSDGAIGKDLAYRLVDGRGNVSPEQLTSLQAILRYVAREGEVPAIQGMPVTAIDDRLAKIRFVSQRFLMWYKKALSKTWSVDLGEPMKRIIGINVYPYRQAILSFNGHEQCTLEAAIMRKEGIPYLEITNVTVTNEDDVNGAYYQILLLLHVLAQHKDVDTVRWDYPRADLMMTEIIDILDHLGGISIQSRSNMNGRFYEVIAKMKPYNISRILNGKRVVKQDAVTDQQPVFSAA